MPPAETGYEIVLDADLTGELDASDDDAVTGAFFTDDFDESGFVDTDDFDAFMVPFELGDPSADFDRSGYVDLDDRDAFIAAYEAGC